MQPSIAPAARADTDPRTHTGIAIAAIDDDSYHCDEPTPMYEVDGQPTPGVRVSRSFSSRVGSQMRYLTFAPHGHVDHSDQRPSDSDNQTQNHDSAPAPTIHCDTEEIHTHGNDLAGVLRYGDMLWEPLAPLSYTGVTQTVLDRLSFSYVPSGPSGRP